MFWDPPDVPLETLPFFTSQYYSQFIDFELTEDEVDRIRGEALDVEHAFYSADDIALCDYVSLLEGRDDEKARQAALLITDTDMREAVIEGLDHPIPRDVY